MVFQCMCRCNGLHHYKCMHHRPQQARPSQVLSNAFESLSPQEQDRVTRDLCGTEKPIEENPRFLQQNLEKLDDELNLLSDEVRKYYTLAINQERRQIPDDSSSSSSIEEYITSEKFRLMFLRCERFDAKSAARRLTQYFQEKFVLFGEQKLSRRIRQTDFVDSDNEDDTRALHSGAFCFTGTTDGAGRPVVVARRHLCLEQNVMSLKRVVFYMTQNILEEYESSQTKGIVGVIYDVGSPPTRTNPSKIRKFLPIPRLSLYTLPMRIAGIHICYDDFRDHMILNLIFVVHQRDVRARMRIHYYDSYEQCMFALIPYSINPDTLPIPPDNSVPKEKIKNYLDRQSQLEDDRDGFLSYDNGGSSIHEQQTNNNLHDLE